MSDASSPTPADLAMTAFDPALYSPRPIADVELFDRGEDEPQESRYVLTARDGHTSVILAESDKLLWEMFDGKTSVDDICHQYLSRHRTLVLNRIFSLIQRLWASGFLLNDPKIAAVSDGGQPVWYQRFRLAHWSPVPLPGAHLVIRPLGALVRALRLQSMPFLALQLVLIVAGGICFNQLTGHHDYSIIKVSTNYVAPIVGVIPESYVGGLLMLLVIHFLCSLLRHLYVAASETAVTGRIGDFSLEFNYFLPCFDCDRRWLPTLPYRRRLTAGISGILFELDMGAIGAILAQVCEPTGLAGELLYKVTFLFFLRAFLHLSPLPGSDLPRVMELLSNIRNFGHKSLGFFRHSFVNSLIGDLQLGVEHRYYIAYNLVSAFWLGLAASFGFELFSANLYVINNLLYVYEHATAITSTLVMGGDGGYSSEMLIMAEERHLLALVFGVLLLLVLAALAISIYWGLYVFSKWLESLPVWRNPNVLVSTGLLLIVAVAISLHFYSVGSLYSARQARGCLHFLTYLIALGGGFYMVCQLGALGRSWLGTKFGTLTLGILMATASLWLESDWVTNYRAISVLHGVAAALAILAVLSGLFGRVHLLAFRKTEFFLPELAIIMGCLVFASGSLRGVFGGPGLAVAIDLNRFVGSAMALLGMLVFLRLLRTLDLSIDSLALDMGKDSEVEALKRVLSYVMEATARLISARFGEPALEAIEKRFNTGLETPAFAFSSIYVDENATAEEVGKVYRDRLEHVRAILASMYGQNFATRVFDEVFGRVHWECKRVLDQYLFPYSPWEGRYVSEQELTTDERTRLIESISMFRELAPNERQLLVRHSMVSRKQAGELVVRQGDYGESCYILVSGEVQVEEIDSTGEVRLLAFLRTGDFFGESALLNHSPRIASVRATTDCLMLSLSRSDFEKFTHQYPEMVHRIRDRLQNLQALLRIPLFGDLPSTVLRSVLPRIRTERFDEGDTIISQGDAGKHFYLVKSGGVEVLATRGGEQETICELGPRDYFGEIALLKDIPRTATVRAVRPTELLVLDKDDFAQLNQENRIFAENVELVGRQRMAAN